MLVKLREEAQADLLEAAWFYEQQCAGLANRFLDSIKIELLTLQRHAGIHEQAFGFHRQLVGRYPFAIYYLVTESLVDVVAILDCRRNPVDNLLYYSSDCCSERNCSQCSLKLG
jgi:plasmid stabilization system protein ParE